MSIVRRKLFDTDLVQIAHVRARPVSSGLGEVERQAENVLVLPLAGVFAKHDGPRRSSLATANDALLIAADTSYRLSFPGSIGDECLTLRFTPDSLARLAPHAMAGDRFDTAGFAVQLPLTPQLMLARSQLWRALVRNAADPLAVEQIAVNLLCTTLHGAQHTTRKPAKHAAFAADSARAQRVVRRVLEAIHVAAERRWTLASLAALGGVSPWQLSHIFRVQTGASVYQHVLRARLVTTLHAVIATDADLARIAHDAGFASHSHFTARFHALFGLTPRQLRGGGDRERIADLHKIVTVRAQRQT